MHHQRGASRGAATDIWPALERTALRTCGPQAWLRSIWDLADADRDGALTVAEFAVALYFVERAKEARFLTPALQRGFGLITQEWRASTPGSNYEASGQNQADAATQLCIAWAQGRAPPPSIPPGVFPPSRPAMAAAAPQPGAPPPAQPVAPHTAPQAAPVVTPRPAMALPEDLFGPHPPQAQRAAFSPQQAAPRGALPAGAYDTASQAQLAYGYGAAPQLYMVPPAAPQAGAFPQQQAFAQQQQPQQGPQQQQQQAPSHAGLAGGYASSVPLVPDHLMATAGRDEAEKVRALHTSAEAAERELLDKHAAAAAAAATALELTQRTRDLSLFKSRCEAELSEAEYQAGRAEAELQEAKRRHDMAAKARRCVTVAGAALTVPGARHAQTAS